MDCNLKKKKNNVLNFNNISNLHFLFRHSFSNYNFLTNFHACTYFLWSHSYIFSKYTFIFIYFFFLYYHVVFKHYYRIDNLKFLLSTKLLIHIMTLFIFIKFRSSHFLMYFLKWANLTVKFSATNKTTQETDQKFQFPGTPSLSFLKMYLFLRSYCFNVVFHPFFNYYRY